MSSEIRLDRYKTVRIFFVFLISCNFASGVYYKIKNVQCEANQNYFENISCVLKPINWTRSILNMEFDVIGNLNDATLIVETFYRDLRNLYKPSFFKFQYNVCHLLNKPEKINIFESFALHHFKTSTNINHSCPYTGHLFARNFHLDEISLPPIPLKEYKILFTLKSNKPSVQLGTVLLFFEAREEYRRHSPKPKTK